MFYKQDSSDYKQILPGIFMKALTHGNKTLLCEFQLKEGSVIPTHQHPQEQIGYLVSGELKFISDGEEFVALPGSSWIFEGGKPHGVEVIKDSVVIEVFSPVRQDYLDLSSK